MLEIPESRTIGDQASQVLRGKTIVEVVEATRPHKFAFFNGTPVEIAKLLKGRKVAGAKGHGMFVDVYCDSDVALSVGDGTHMHYHQAGTVRPDKHQLLIAFDDGSFISFTVSMYGSISAYREEFDNPYHHRSLYSISPLNDAFDAAYFDEILRSTHKDLSAKALLATEQRIPGLGNGVLQDILFNAGIHPKRKRSTLHDAEVSDLFSSIKSTLQSMTEQGGRDTERDLFGNQGRYKTLLSKNTYGNACPLCGGPIEKETYLGGAVYFCPVCQPL